MAAIESRAAEHIHGFDVWCDVPVLDDNTSPEYCLKRVATVYAAVRDQTLWEDKSFQEFLEAEGELCRSFVESLVKTMDADSLYPSSISYFSDYGTQPIYVTHCAYSAATLSCL